MARHLFFLILLFHAWVSRHPDVNVVVFLGASHVGPVQEELNKLDKNCVVITLPDVLK